MEFKEIVVARHSVRKYSSEAVSREVIDRIIAEAATAPSSKNTRSTGFMVVEDPSLIEALSQMRDSGSAFLAGAPVVLVVLGDTSKTDMWVENCSISSTFVQLAAVDEGLGSCWVQVRGRQRCKNDASKGMAEDYVRELLGIKEQYGIMCLISLGFEAE